MQELVYMILNNYILLSALCPEMLHNSFRSISSKPLSHEHERRAKTYVLEIWGIYRTLSPALGLPEAHNVVSVIRNLKDGNVSRTESTG